MIAFPSSAIKQIESERITVIKRLELLRNIAKEMIEFDFPLEEYMKYDPISKHRDNSLERLRVFRRETITRDYGGERVAKCLDMISMLKSFKSARHKPSDETIKSTQTELIIKYCYSAYALPEELLSDIDNDIAETNKKVDDFKHVVEVMRDYGITDSQYERVHRKRYSRHSYQESLVRMSYLEKTVEAVDLANFIEESNHEQKLSWWERLFFKNNIDDTTKAALNRLLDLYSIITDAIC